MAKILVVDDSAFVRLRTARLLREAGHEVIEAATGKAAIDAYVAERPDAVLMDITMPEMDGLEALDQIRTLDPSAKVAMVTAIGQQSVVMDAIRRGAGEFLVKPFAVDPFFRAVNRLLR
jgi:two-component system, chemotaxis family, chemotaxis protein CheY